MWEMNKKFFQAFFTDSVCLHCGSMNRVYGGLCNWCNRQLLKNTTSFTGRAHDLEIHAFFHWHQRESDVLSKLLLHLKGPQSDWDYWGQKWSELWEEGLGRMSYGAKSKYILIPAPRQGDKPDHALKFCKALSLSTGLEMEDCLRLKTSRSQKKMSMNDRSRDWGENIYALQNTNIQRPGKRLILVDDIVTTGATALESFKALNYHGKKTVFSLARRAPSLPEKMDCVSPE